MLSPLILADCKIVIGTSSLLTTVPPDLLAGHRALLPIGKDRLA